MGTSDRLGQQQHDFRSNGNTKYMKSTDHRNCKHKKPTYKQVQYLLTMYVTNYGFTWCLVIS